MKSCSQNQNRQRVTAAALSVALLMTAHGGPALGPSYVNFPAVSMGGVKRGQDAISGLGLQLPEVARAYGLTATELHLRLRSDSSLAVDPRGRLLFTDPLTAGEVGDTSTQIPSPPVLLESDPSTQIPSPPVLLEGDPSTQIPSPPVLLGETPSSQIPSPPVLLGGTPSSQIPSPPVLLGGTPSEQIPSPPVRVQENGLAGNPFDQIPSPPVRMTMSALETPQPVDAFKLHSRPGAKRTIFLDFNGEVMSGNAWTEFYNGGTNIVAPAYDTDGSPTTFSDSERTRIIQIWQRVAEDYAPFDIDVTTELFSEAQLTRSNPTDEYYGVRVLISPLSSYFGNYGGVSYVGTFNDIGDSWKPSLVFSDKLGATSDKNIAEAASHEAGHALGLSHDGVLNGASYFAGNGTGETGWAPIMGVGYSKNVTQWSRGEYASASNTQDDLAVMQNYGVTYRADDHGDTLAVASYLPLGIQLAASGIIERNTDVDVFAFVAGDGVANVTVAPQSRGPNLDVRATLYDSTGALVAVASSSTTLSAVFNLNLPAGTYFLAVQGEGRGSVTTGYSTYGSLGNYAITGTVANPVQPVAPVAVINPSVVAGTAPLSVSFDGSLSFDSDGSVVAYDWNFGDGQTAQGAIVNHAYSQAGTYTAVLTITDNSGLTHSESLSIEVAPANVPPTARISVSTASGTMPLAVVFGATGSTDSDGQIVAYAWDFGDGSTAVGETVQHSFVAAGTYQVNLAVLDNLGAVSVASTTIVVKAVEQRILRIETITTRTVVTPTGTTAYALVRVTNPSGSPISGVAVTGRWAGLASNNKTANTDVNGQVEIASKKVTTAGTLTFSITKMVLANYTYDPSLNQVSTASVVVTAP